MHRTDPGYAARPAAYGTVATRLSLLSDRRLGDIVAGAAPLASGIGGRSTELDIDGTRVFVKRVPLTEIELRPENARSTANLFGLPMFYRFVRALVGGCGLHLGCGRHRDQRHHRHRGPDRRPLARSPLARHRAFLRSPTVHSSGGHGHVRKER